jgi:curli biogenesis system outer membrane secretion channel CsgG
MNARLIISCLILSWLPLIGVAETSLKEQVATGHGDTYQEALAAALFNAANQVKGVAVHSEKQMHMEIERSVGNASESMLSTVGTEEKIFTLSNGWIDSYSVTSSSKPAGKDGSWSVTVKARIPEHQTSVTDDPRKRIAVMPFRFAHSIYALDGRGSGSDAYQLSQRMRDRILSSLTQSQRFVVLNRELNSDFFSEKSLLSSDNVPPAEASRLGQLAGADYMLVGNIHKLYTEAEDKDFYGVKNTQLTDKVDVSWQLIEVASQKVEWADTIKAEHVRKQDDSTDETLDNVASLVMAGLMDALSANKMMGVNGTSQTKQGHGSAGNSSSAKAVRETPGSSPAPVQW